MTANPARTIRAVMLVRACAGGAFALGAFGLLGWVIEGPALKSVLVGAVAMKVNTALGLMACAAALWAGLLERSPRLQAAATVLATAAALLGVATLGQYAFGYTFGIDELLFRDTAEQFTAQRGRMSPISALAFGCLGVALAALPRPGLALLVRALAVAVLSTGLLVLLGGLWKAPELPADSVALPVAINSAAGFMLLGAGMLVASLSQARTRRLRPLASTERKVMGGFVGSLVLMAMGVGAAYQSTADFNTAVRQIGKGQAVRSALAGVDLEVSDAALAQRNYLVTGEPAQLQQWQLQFERIQGGSDALKRLLADNPRQTASMEQHALLTARFIASQAEEVLLHQAERGASRATSPKWAVSEAAMLALRAVSREMDALEAVELLRREEAFSRSRSANLASLIGALLAGAVALNLIFLSIRREIVARAAAEEATREAAAAAQASDSAKSTFLATMSHEIRTPMNGMLGMLELMSLTRLDPEQQATLAVVNASSRSLMRIIDDILDFSKIEAGRLDIHLTAGSVEHLVKSVYGIYSVAASAKGVLLAVRVDPRISPALLLDSARVRQILNNLVSNAVKFTAGGRIELAAELLERTHDRERLEFSVIDTGTGISLQSQKLLFKPFTQNPDDPQEPGSGTGLGLSISRRLAELMGGTLEMESAPGKGTRVSLILSLRTAPRDQLPSPELERAAVFNTTGGMRRTAPGIQQAEAEGTLVLLVDDHPTNRALMGRQINLLGYACEVAEDGDTALELWQTGRFGLVITDCRMPGMDGYELTNRVRAIEAARGRKRTPVVACTASALEGEAERCLLAGMDDCLVKPVNLAQLLKKLDRWLPVARNASDPVDLPCADVQRDVRSEPLDEALITATWGGGPEGLVDALRMFRRANDADAIALRRAVAAGDMPGIGHAAHRMTGAGRMVGADGLADVCQRIDMASRASDWAGLSTALQAFEHEFARLTEYFDRRLQPPAELEAWVKPAPTATSPT